MIAEYAHYRLKFRFVARTSREEMSYKDTYFIRLTQEGKVGIGECALFRGLSCDDVSDYEDVLARVCRELSAGRHPDLSEYPSIRFGVETAMRGLSSSSPFEIFRSAWTDGGDAIRINGLVWMGSASEMVRRVREKLDSGFRCIKLKIGGVAFAEELAILKMIRREYDADVLELRLDANGAFCADNVMERLDALAQYDIHSIEQPVRQGQPELMAGICANSPIAIALDEELIGVNKPECKMSLLRRIKPQYIILKPALCGGFSGADEWIAAAGECGAGWWATSALESNIGLNAIAQWCYTKNPEMPQGLGTGMLYENNVTSPLALEGECLRLVAGGVWRLPVLNWRN